MSTETALLKTALHSEHVALKARLVPFASYDMPVQYSGVMDEHLAVRSSAGLFDVSHMGIATCEGPRAQAFLNFAVTRDLSSLVPGKAAYTLLCLENGGTLDDLIIYQDSPTKFYLVLNASNKHKDFAHFQKLAKLFLEKNSDTSSTGKLTNSIELNSHFDSHSLLALQGPQVENILKALGYSMGMLPAFSFIESTLHRIPVRIAFTGYTGEKGCEIFVSNSHAVDLWRAILSVGKAYGIKPIGLAARDTLRTEMGYSLYGHELGEEINPIEAGLSWAVGFKKESFMGKAALVKAKAEPQRKLICLKNSSKQAPRESMSVKNAKGETIGKITSGTFAPSLGHAIGMALVQSTAEPPYFVDIRGTLVPFELTTRPFFKK